MRKVAHHPRLLQPRLITNAAEWDRSILKLPEPHILQSWEWGAFKAKYGWTPTRVLFCDGDKPRAAAQVLRRPLPRTPFGVLYVPKGPVLDYSDAHLFAQTLSHLEEYARRRGAIFIKVDPDVRTGTPPAAELARRGWRPSSEQIQYRNTV